MKLFLMVLITCFCLADAVIKIDNSVIEESKTTTTTNIIRYDIKFLKEQKQNITASINKLQLEKSKIQALIDAAKLLGVE